MGEEEAAGVAEREASARRIKPKDALTARFDAYAEREADWQLGFKWEAVGAPPADGVELSNSKLADALYAALRKESHPEYHTFLTTRARLTGSTDA